MVVETFKQQLYDEYVTAGQAALDVPSLSRSDLKTGRPYLHRIIQRFVPADRQCRILDLGCGHGACLLVLKRLGYHNIAGVDTSQEQVDAAHQLGVEEIELGEMHQFVMKQSQAADVIFLLDVLEHLGALETQQFIQTVFSKLAPNGRLIIHVPNGEGLFGQRIRYGDLTHETCFTPRSIRQLLIPIGFQVVQCFEDKPIPHGFLSMIRRIIWEVGTIGPRLLLMAESGKGKFILSQNMLVVADKARGDGCVNRVQ